VPKEASERYLVQDIVVDVDAGEVARGGTAIALPPRTFELLVALARRYPHVVRRQELLEVVWPDETVTDQTLSHRVMVLRRALGNHADEPRYVAGERGWGYRLLGPVERVGSSARRSTDVPGSPPRAGRAASVAQVVGLLALLLGIIWVVVRRAPPSPHPRTVAVTPLATDGLAPGLESLGADMARAIAARLRRGGGLRVVRWGGGEPRPNLWIEGSVSGSPERIEVRLQLREGAGQGVIWTRDFHGRLYDVVADERGMVDGAVMAIRRRLGLPEAAALAEVPPRLLWHCLQSEVLWLSWTGDGIERAKAGWNAVLEMEPRYAPAHARVALAEAVGALLGYGPTAEAEAQARAHAERALELDAQSGMAHAAEAMVRLLFDRDLAAAAAAAQRAHDAEPDELSVLMVGALVLEAQGRFDDSLVRLLQEPEAPEWAGILLLQGRAQQAKGRWNEAIAAYDQALALEPGLAAARRGRAECLTAAGRVSEALVALRGEESKAPMPPGPGAPTSDAPELTRVWRRLCQTAQATPRERARACLLGADPDGALEALRTAVESRSPFVVFVPKDPAFAPLAKYPGFAGLLPQVKLHSH
jgi:DNA-binding winged helix-turn-helix (wHTH) protein/tetratricopeptide (TPR) repeat protein